MSSPSSWAGSCCGQGCIPSAGTAALDQPFLELSFNVALAITGVDSRTWENDSECFEAEVASPPILDRFRSSLSVHTEAHLTARVSHSPAPDRGSRPALFFLHEPLGSKLGSRANSQVWSLAMLTLQEWLMRLQTQMMQQKCRIFCRIFKD